MKNKKYVAPTIYVRTVNIKAYILSLSQTLRKTTEDPIVASEEILTKERPFFDDKEAFMDNIW